MTVGYKMDTMYLSAFGSHAIDVNLDLGLPAGVQLLEDRNIQDCSMNYTVGRYTHCVLCNVLFLSDLFAIYHLAL